MTLAVFASERGPGDAERASIMSLVGGLLARHHARVVCLAHGSALPVPLITSARAAGGEVRIIADEAIRLPAALASVSIERIAVDEARLSRVAELADLFVGLPGSLASATDLYKAWVRAGAGSGRKPVVLLNRNRAFDVVRGMYADVISHSVRGHEKLVTFTDNPEDLWNKVAAALGRPVPLWGEASS